MSQYIKKNWYIYSYRTSQSFNNGQQIVGSTFCRKRTPREILKLEPNLENLTSEEARHAALKFIKIIYKENENPQYVGLGVALIGGVQESFSVSYRDSK